MGELVGLGEVVARWQARLEGCDVGGGVCDMAMLVVEVALAVVWGLACKRRWRAWSAVGSCPRRTSVARTDGAEERSQGSEG